MRKDRVAKRRTASIAIIIPTFNSYALVNRHLDILEKQTRKDFDAIIIDSGNSNDRNLIRTKRGFGVVIKYFKDDLGGSGSAYEGMKYAYGKGYRHMILTDSDAFPVSRNLVEKLVANADEKTVAYATNIIKRYRKGQGPEKEEVRWAPWHYLTFSREMVGKLGLPRRDLFIYNDDVEYSNRIIRIGRILQLNRVFYTHDNSTLTTYFLRGMTARSSYYTLRNRILSKPGAKNKASVILNSFTRAVIGAYALDPKDLWAYWSLLSRGVTDGLSGRAGRIDTPKIELKIEISSEKEYPRDAVYLTYVKKDSAIGKMRGKTRDWEIIDISKGISNSSILGIALGNRPVVVNDYVANQQITTRLTPFLLAGKLYLYNDNGLFHVQKRRG
ncbi:MAG TPA: glycosyltransferase [Candidatus Saccharimonadales bacterium]|nr:glycosyltransferase [Candidatus Saccharimonadales bacterium]